MGNNPEALLDMVVAMQHNKGSANLESETSEDCFCHYLCNLQQILSFSKQTHL